MRFLLDTQVFLWWLQGSNQLSAENHARIADPDHAIYVSAVTAWEIVIKAGLGRLKFPLADYGRILADNSFRSLSVSSEHAVAVANLPDIHRDPFDRLLVAQALTDDLVLLTQDEQVAAYL